MKASRSRPASSRSAAALGEAGLELGDDPGVLVVHGGGVGLGEDRAHHRRDEALRALGDAHQEVAHEVAAAALPGGAGSVAAIASTRPGCASELTSFTPARPRATKPRTNASQAAPSSAVTTSSPSNSRKPSRLTPTAWTTQTLTVRPPSPALHHQRVERHVRIRRAVERPSTELLDDPIE